MKKNFADRSLIHLWAKKGKFYNVGTWRHSRDNKLVSFWKKIVIQSLRFMLAISGCFISTEYFKNGMLNYYL
jgi:hypothetical protein